VYKLTQHVNVKTKKYTRPKDNKLRGFFPKQTISKFIIVPENGFFVAALLKVVYVF